MISEGVGLYTQTFQVKVAKTRNITKLLQLYIHSSQYYYRMLNKNKVCCLFWALKMVGGGGVRMCSTE